MTNDRREGFPGPSKAVHVLCSRSNINAWTTVLEARLSHHLHHSQFSTSYRLRAIIIQPRKMYASAIATILLGVSPMIVSGLATPDVTLYSGEGHVNWPTALPGPDPTVVDVRKRD